VSRQHHLELAVAVADGQHATEPAEAGLMQQAAQFATESEAPSGRVIGPLLEEMGEKGDLVRLDLLMVPAVHRTPMRLEVR